MGNAPRLLIFAMTLVGYAVLAGHAAAQVRLKGVQQARTDYLNAIQINNPASTSTCGLGIARWAAGDTLVAVVTLDMQQATDNSSILNTVSAAGFTPVGSGLYPRAVGSLQQVVLYRSLTSAPSGVTFTWSPAPGPGQVTDSARPYIPASVVLHVFSGARPIDPVIDPIWYGFGSISPLGYPVLVDPGMYSPPAVPPPGSLQVLTYADRGATASASTRITAATTPMLSGCNNTVGRYGRLVGTSLTSPNDGANLAVASFVQPLSLLPGNVPQAFWTPKTGEDAIGISFLVSP